MKKVVMKKEKGRFKDREVDKKRMEERRSEMIEEERK